MGGATSHPLGRCWGSPELGGGDRLEAGGIPCKVGSQPRETERERPPRERATDRRSGGQDPSPGQVQVNRQRRSKGHSDGAVRKGGGGGQASEECSEMDGATVRPPQRAGAGTWTPRVTSGVSGRAVSADLGKCRLGGAAGAKACLHWAQEITGRGVEREREPFDGPCQEVCRKGVRKMGLQLGGDCGAKGWLLEIRGTFPDICCMLVVTIQERSRQLMTGEGCKWGKAVETLGGPRAGGGQLTD